MIGHVSCLGIHRLPTVFEHMRSQAWCSWAWTNPLGAYSQCMGQACLFVQAMLNMSMTCRCAVKFAVIGLLIVCGDARIVLLP
jgi:multisubunit Na+/H+ antiporter MnhG subunit